MTKRKSTKKKINKLDFLKQIMGTYLKEHLEQEMSHHLNALPYERTGTRRRLVISGAHPGLVKAVEENFPGCQWQRCQVHFKKNMLDKVRNKDKAWVKKRLDDIFLAPDKETGFERL